MYVPAAFAEPDLSELHDLIERYSFGVLVSQHPEFSGSHLPFLLDRQAGPQGQLIGHMARANSQWQDADGTPVLVIFSGPHAYISPVWYEAKNVVPTWNYVAVHVTGTLRIIDSEADVGQIVQHFVAHYERNPNQFKPLDEEFQSRLLSMIVGFTIDIESIEGKRKLSQNHSRERQEKVIRGLRQNGDPSSCEVAALMEKQLGLPVDVVTPSQQDAIGTAFLEESRIQLTKAAGIVRHSVRQLTDEQLWWRPSDSQNSIANLVLHLCGNVRQWIVAGIGGTPDERNRPLEFSERNSLTAIELMQRFDESLALADEVLQTDFADKLLSPRRIQGFETTGLSAIFDSVAHFKGHTQEIVSLTRMQLKDHYQFEWIPTSPEEGAP